MGVLPACISVHAWCMLGTYKDQKRASASLELKLKMVVSCHMDGENQTWVLSKAASALNF